MFLLLILLALPVAAQTRLPKIEIGAAQDEVARVPAMAPVEAKPAQRILSLTFKEMGALAPLQLRGVEGSAVLPFSIRSDEVVVAAKLKFNYHYSPALIPELSHLKILLNDEVVSAIALPREKTLNSTLNNTQTSTLTNTREIELDPRLFADFNKLRFALIGHYTYRCEDPMHSSLWLSMSHLGRIELTLAPLTLANDLKYLPGPFFDKRDNAILQLPFVFAGEPSFGSIKAAGIVASWFGGLASYRGARFPVLRNTLPMGNAVVFLQGNEKITGIDSSPSATVSIVAHPTSPGSKLLLVSGKNDEEMLRAARAIVLNHATLAGQGVFVTQDKEPPVRKPYDAPAWVPIDRPVRFGELARQEDLDVKGFFPEVVRLNFRVSPDLFTWRSKGVPVELKYRFTRLPYSKNASLNVNANQRFLQALALNTPGKLAKTADALNLSATDGNLSILDNTLYIPSYQVSGRNQLQFQYYFDLVKEGECGDSFPDNLQAAIDPDSTIDFSGFPRYSALPNLAYFSSLGFPFTKMADLSETAVIMPERPNAAELTSYLTLMGRMGEATNYPVLRHVVVPASQLEKVTDNDLIVIGSAQNQPLMEKWAEQLPLVQSKGVRTVREPDIFRRMVYRWAEQDVQDLPRPAGSMSLKDGGDLVSMMAFESPLKAGRSVVFLYADKAADLVKMVDAMSDPEQLAQVQGDFVVFNGKRIEHAKVADTYYVGNLPWITHLRWFFSRYPLLGVLMGLLISILLAVVLYRLLRKIAARRLGKKH